MSACIECKEQLYNNQFCLKCCKDSKFIIFYTDIKKLYKLTDTDITKSKLKKIKYRGCRKFIREDVHRYVGNLVKTLPATNRISLAYNKVVYMEEQEKIKEQEFNNRIENLVEIINTLLIKYDLSLDINVQIDIRNIKKVYTGLKYLCNSTKDTDKQITKKIIKDTVNYFKRRNLKTKLYQLENIDLLIKYNKSYINDESYNYNKNDDDDSEDKAINCVKKTINRLINIIEVVDSKLSVTDINIINMNDRKKIKDKCIKTMLFYFERDVVKDVEHHINCHIAYKQELERKRKLNAKLKKYANDNNNVSVTEIRNISYRLYSDFVDDGDIKDLDEVFNKIVKKVEDRIKIVDSESESDAYSNTDTDSDTDSDSYPNTYSNSNTDTDSDLDTNLDLKCSY